jgi:hypothetical protein
LHKCIKVWFSMHLAQMCASVGIQTHTSCITHPLLPQHHAVICD